MKFRDLRTNLFDHRTGLKYALAFVIIIFSIVPALPQTVRNPNSDEIRKLINKADKRLRNEALPEAEEMLRRAIDLDPARSEAKVELAYVMVKAHRPLEAYHLCFPIAEAEPKNSRAFAVLGTILLSAGRFAEARMVLVNALKLNHKEDLAWAGLGMSDFYENRINESLVHLQQAINYKYDQPDYLFAYAQVSGRAEHYKDAADAYDRYLDVSNVNDKDRRARIRGLINFLHYLGQTGPLYAPRGEEESAVGFELVGNRPIINIRINDYPEPLRFVLDTGSGISVISDATAKRLKIKPITKGGFARGIGGTGKFEIVYGLLRDVGIGAVSIRNVPVFLRKFHDPGQKVDGYIGLALISKFLATIDYGKQTFALTKKAADNVEFQKNDLFSLPLRLTSSGFLSGEVQLEGVDSTLNFIVDTGASVSVISDRVAKFGGISTFLSDEKVRVIGSAGVTDSMPTFLLPRITFGSHSRKSVQAVALDLDMINEASGFEQAGILGGNFLKNYRVTFDFKNSKVVFESVTPEN